MSMTALRDRTRASLQEDIAGYERSIVGGECRDHSTYLAEVARLKSFQLALEYLEGHYRALAQNDGEDDE